MIIIKAGKSYSLPFEFTNYILLENTKVVFGAKADLSQDEFDLYKEETISSPTQYVTFEFTADETKDLLEGDYRFEIDIIVGDESPKEVFEGNLHIRKGVTA